MLVKLTTFTGEIPKLPPQLLPDNAAQFCLNCDFQHGELRGILNWTLKSAIPLYQGVTIVSAWTENGDDFFGWPFETTVVKSPVINDPHYRIYYTAITQPGPIIKVAQTHRAGGQKVINSLVPNFFPPEALDPYADSLAAWTLGVPIPKVQNVSVDDKLALTLYDLPSWPLMPNMALRVTYFLEDTGGAIVWQTDITNTEKAVGPVDGITYPAVIYTNDSSLRGNKIQDMLWPLGYTPRPYKYYWFQPPDTSSVILSRTVTITNTDASGNPFIITYGSSVPTPEPTPGGGSEGNEA